METKIQENKDAYLAAATLERANVPRWVQFQTSTLDEFVQHVRKVEGAGGEVLKPSHLSGYLATKAGERPATLHRRAGIVRAWARWMEESGIPCPLARTKLRAPRPEDRPLPSWAELWGLTSSMPNDHHRAAACLLLLTGCRRGELLGTRWEEIDRAAGVLNLPAGRTKAGKARAVPLTPRALELLEELKAARPKGRGPFLDGRGRPVMCPHGLSHAWRRHADDAGHTRVRLHDLRHAFGRGAVAIGADIVSLQAVMGHSCITVTRRYLAPSPDAARALGAKLHEAGR